jgi:hypothetical protein
MKAVYSRSVIAAEDVAITTHDFDRADVNAVEAAAIAARMTTFWQALGVLYSTSIRLLECRFYNGYNGDGSPGEVDHVIPINVPGTSAALMLPPQCACSVTEEIESRRSWGRFYLPNMVVTAVDESGRYDPTTPEFIAVRAETMYNGWRADGHEPAVWVDTAVVPDRHMESVEAIRVDDIVDIQRRRRWDTRLQLARKVLV